ncbi:hypothetical protein M5689_022540 [Euphorbia peplus]|nr:hypothetical protein M5689_022540 [Euphorbia peplus]
MLDVNTMEPDPLTPGNTVRFKKMLDLIVINIERENLVRRLGEYLLAEMRADETSGADHAYRHLRNRFSIQIYSVIPRRRHFNTRKEDKNSPENTTAAASAVDREREMCRERKSDGRILGGRDESMYRWRGRENDRS